MKIPVIAILLFVLALSLPTSVKARDKSLCIKVPTYSDGTHTYFKRLLRTALEQDGQDVILELIPDVPHLRERHMLETGALSVLWLIRSEKRDKRYLPIPVNLTNGLVGKRFLLVPKSDTEMYSDVTTLSDFRQLGKVGGFGTKWFDTQIWQANGLPYREVADWRLLYNIIENGSRGVDYFSRGFNEIINDARKHPKLAIEPHLLLVFDRDYIFYVSPTQPHLVKILESALTKARDSGLIARLSKKHWAEDYAILKPDNRKHIRLNTPK